MHSCSRLGTIQDREIMLTRSCLKLLIGLAVPASMSRTHDAVNANGCPSEQGGVSHASVASLSMM